MEERIGRQRSEGAYAFRKLKDAGAVLIFGSDSPGTNAARYFLNPVYGLYAAVSRQTLAGEPKAGWFPDQRLTIEGTAPSRLLDAKVLYAIVGGRMVYQR